MTEQILTLPVTPGFTEIYIHKLSDRLQYRSS